ncbi:MAG: MoaD/ThiS family protein [Bacteroidetes bacterium]|nr:MoaD/ThiS family protein [Bacteroidota bacterium]
MKIKFEYIGLLHIDGIKNHSEIELENDSTINDLFNKLKIRNEHRQFISAFVNGEEKKRFSVLKNDDKVKLFLPTGGG